MTYLALFLLAVLVWAAAGLAVAYRIQPKVTGLALMVLGSAMLWPLTWWTSRHKRSAGRVQFGEETVSGD